SDSSSLRWKAQVKGPSGTTYTYNLFTGEWAVLPLSDGNGAYTIKVFRNANKPDKPNSYLTITSLKDCTVSMNDEFAPFIRPNQYVNYENATLTMNTASTVLAGKKDLLEKVAAIYNYVVNNLSYDYDKAATVKSGYLPDLDAVLATKKGICFDYAALMTGMLRSQGIPCKLVIGYAGTIYHAWISVWSEGTGWIDSAIYFNGTTWQRMDPTFASTGGGVFDPNSIEYTTKYIY
ncbi:MAG: transglutaminase domain-containing protein, partial [Lachnospiraceae bacterium]|nr:transglutaminase domain-containing protein [Lachnospiraceae bacterium]